MSCLTAKWRLTELIVTTCLTLVTGGQVSLSAGVTDLQVQGLKYAPVSQKLSILQRLLEEKNKVYLPEIAALLDDQVKEVRSQAAFCLVEFGDSTCLPAFRRGLNDTWWKVRLYCAQGLVKHGDGSIVPELLRCLDDSYWQVRYYGAAGLGKFADEEVLEGLLSHLRDNNPQVVEELLWALHRLFWRDAARSRFKKLPEEKIRPFTDLITNKVTAIRIRCLWAMEASQDERVVPFLVKALDDAEAEVQLRSLWALERLRATQARFSIESLLENPSVKLRLESIKTLVRLHSTDTVDGLLRRLRDPDENVRIYSLWALERIREPASYPEIGQCLADSSRRVREYAASVIQSLKDAQFLPVLQNLVRDEKIPEETRVVSLQLIGALGNPSVKDFLMEEVKSENAPLRAEAFRAWFGIDRFDRMLLKALCFAEKNDTSALVRKTASQLLKDLKTVLTRNLNSGDRTQRQQALEVAEEIIDAAEMGAVLREMGKSEYPEVREAMARLAAIRPGPGTTRLLTEMMGEPNIVVRRSAALALAELRDRAAVGVLKRNLSSEDQELRLNCAWALARLGEKDGATIALTGLQNPDVLFQKRAVETLGYLGDSGAIGPLLKVMTDSELEVKAAAGWALARLGEPKGIEMLVRLSEQSVEPVRTQANKYLSDSALPWRCRHLIPLVRSQLVREKLGMKEATYRRIKVLPVSGSVVIDGKDSERFWKTIPPENTFILSGPELVPADVQSWISFAYDDKNLYFLCVCEDPQADHLTRFSRDFVSIALQRESEKDRWYQFVLHPFNDIHYAYIWKFYQDDEKERSWTSSWETATTIQSHRWLAEGKIPLADIGITGTPPPIFYINIHRESGLLGTSTFTGRLDNWEQFGLLIFEPKP